MLTYQPVAQSLKAEPIKCLPSVLWLRERFNWMGAFSGYDQVIQAIEAKQSQKSTSIWRETTGSPIVSQKILRWLARKSKTSPFYDPRSTSAEIKALFAAWHRHPQLIHITYVENELGLLSTAHKSSKLIGTCHQPASWWRLMHPCPESLANLDSLIVLSKQEIPYFQQFLDLKVHFIPHGVDVNFFQPKASHSSPKPDTPRCVFSGSWLRDLETLSHVIDKVLHQNPKVQFDILLPRRKRNSNTALHRIARHSQVLWHADLNDKELLEIYQQASVLLLPLLDCTANNGLLEAMACGLPVVSNQIGGIPDYTTTDFASLLEVGDVNGMASAVLELLEDPQKQQQCARKARQHAVENFSWDNIALQTLEVYNQVVFQ